MLALVCVTLLWARVDGAHLHLCFDGNGPATSLHLTDIDHHGADHGGHHDSGEGHQDLDIPLGDAPLAKAGEMLGDLPLFLLTVLCIALPVLASARFSRREPARTWTLARGHLRPPLRGPPTAIGHA